MEYAIKTDGLSKAYGPTVAVDGLSLQVAPGTVFGLLGPNGSGKTTTVKLLTTQIRASSGSAHVLGLDVAQQAAQVRSKIAVTGQFASVDDDLTGFENLTLMARLYGFSWRGARQRAKTLLQAFDLWEAQSRQVVTYSGGMRRRLDIAASLVVTPELLFLDEPTTGLDPRSRNQVWDIVKTIAQQGTTVLLTTQYLEEADRLANTLAVIDHGRLIASGTSRELKASVGLGALKVQLVEPHSVNEASQLAVSLGLEATAIHCEGTQLTAQVVSQQQALELLNNLQSQGVMVAEFSLLPPSLDEVFFALTGKSAEPQGSHS